MKRLRRYLLRLFVVAALACLALEASFRWVLFGAGDWPLVVASHRPELRNPESYAHPRSPEHWVLQFRLRDEKYKGREAHYHPELGWRGAAVDVETFAHRDEATVAGRRPVLLLGDSFAGCYGTRENVCFQQLLDRSERGEEYALLNYGVGGYGFGQITRACRLALARFRDRSPVVVVSLLVESDLDRSLLGFRAWPKPRFVLDSEGRVRTDGRELPRERAEYIRRYGIGITSYAWRYLKYGTSVWPASWRKAEDDARFEECCAVNRALLADLVAELREAEVEFWFLLFHGRTFLSGDSKYLPYEEFFVGALEELEVPYLLSYVPLRADAAATGRGVDDYWIGRGPGQGHLTPLGNEVVFPCFLDGLAGRFDGGRR